MYGKYRLSHIAFGSLSNIFTKMDLLFYTWQIFQLLINKRIFALDGKILEGNSIKHTLMKIGEYLIGKIIYDFVEKYLFKSSEKL